MSANSFPYLDRGRSFPGFTSPAPAKRLALVFGVAVVSTAACCSAPAPGENVGSASAALSTPGTTCKPGFCGPPPALIRKNKKSDVNGDLRSDIVLTGGSGKDNACHPETWTTVPIAVSKGDGSFLVSNAGVVDFPGWTTPYAATVVMGDFDGDGRADLAATGVSGWSTIPVAFSNGDGTFRVVNDAVSDFPGWAARPYGAGAVAGDFDGDGKDDIAITGGPNWSTQPIAFSNGDGTFRVTNRSIQDFAAWGFQSAARLLSADFNGDGKDDLALVGGRELNGNPWVTIPVAFSNGDGTFNVTNQLVADVPTWATVAGVGVVAGDFNGDGLGDIALAGGSGWWTIPVAFGKGDGTFNVTNLGVPDFPGWAVDANALLAGDFDDDGKTDLALTGGKGWSTIPVAFSHGDGTFGVTNFGVSAFPGWATPWALASPTSGSDYHLPKALSGSSQNLWKEDAVCSPSTGGSGSSSGGSSGGSSSGGSSSGGSSGSSSGGGPPTCGEPKQPCCSGAVQCIMGGECTVDSTTGSAVCKPCGGLMQICCSTAAGLTCGYSLTCRLDSFGNSECDVGG